MPDSSAEKTSFPLPRGLIMLSCMWITGAWILCMGPRGPLNSMSDDHAEGLRMFSVTLMLGITIAWPMSRLLLRRFTAPIRQSLLDCIVLICSVEVTLWPLRLLSEWSVDRTLSITNILAGWILLMGALVALGAGARGWTCRILIVLGALLLTVCSPLLTDAEALQWWNPVDLTLGVSTIDPERLFGMSPWPGRTAVVQLLLAAIGAWTVVLGARILTRSRHDDLAISGSFE
ncbi:MAG: hypothetical protein CMJ33_10170 [Phycisphaerae bacterium]|nr:hypothetical protein [Phycisphaerae bacterium]HAW96567.1 hypothetical protein [Phycisphaerales bacterium]